MISLQKIAIAFITLVLIHLNSSCYLPQGCKWHTKLDTWYIKAFVCRDTRSLLPKQSEIDENCKSVTEQEPMIIEMIIINNEKKFVLDKSFQLYKMITWIEPYLQYYLTIYNSKGFSVDFYFDLETELPVNLLLSHSDFNFYDQNKTLFRTCEHYRDSMGIQRKYFMFNQERKYHVIIKHTRFKTAVCPLVFQNSRLNNIKFIGFQNSFYKKNYIHFIDLKDVSLDSRIDVLYLEDFFGLDLNTHLIEENVFRNTTQFIFDGVLNSIQKDFFTYFDNLKYIAFNPIYFKSLIRRRGIEWIRYINRGLNVNMSDQKSVASHKTYLKEIDFIYLNAYKLYYRLHMGNKLFDNADFCLIYDIPLNQMIFFNFFNINAKQNCPTIWLMRYHLAFRPLLDKTKQEYLKSFEYNNYSKEIEKCNFEHRLQKCNKSDFHLNNRSVHSLDIMMVTELLLIILSFSTSVFGIVTNSLVVIVVFKNSKTLKEKQYTYMTINSLINMVIFLIQALSLINECDKQFGIFCSSVNNKLAAQYFKIIFGEGVTSVLRLLSNFTYVAFSINRLSLIGTNGKLMEFLSKLGTVKYMIITTFISIAFSVIKGFLFSINRTHPELDSPFIFYQNTESYNELASHIISLVFALDLTYDILCYVVFTLFFLILDTILVVKLKETLEEKQNRLKSMLSSNENDLKKLEIKQKENDEAVKKVTKMVVSNALVSFLLKTPSSIVSINDLRIIVLHSEAKIEGSSKLYFNFPYTFEVSCFKDISCLVFKKLCDFLFLISLSLNFFFFLKCDKQFKEAYDKSFKTKI